MVKFRASLCDFVRNEYKTSKDRFKLNDEQIKEVLSYKDISEKFVYEDWYGSSTRIIATLVKVEQEPCGLTFEIEVNHSIPKHYYPSPFDILKGKGLLMPVSYQRLS